MTATLEEIAKSDKIKELYDEMPYASCPFDYNKPEHLCTIATLFGMSPPALENARILELGCSDGGNSFRFAEIYPNSYTLGVDLSEVEIKNGQDILSQLKLKNMELKAMSITDLDESYGKFDYIICHGVFSWVPDFVRDSILEVSKKLLTENGLAFVSYNTLPGWNMVNTVRELMLYHSAGFDNIQDKILQSRAALNFLQSSLDGQDTPHAKFMGEMAKHMSEQKDYYLRHEYLGDENKAFYFHDVIDMVRAHGLEYLGDADIQKMYTGTLPPEVAEKLNSAGDVVKVGQYIDFIQNTQFRSTILCHQGASIMRDISADLLKKLYFYCTITSKPTEEGLAPNIVDDSHVNFYLDNVESNTLGTASPAIKAVFTTFAQNRGNALSFDELAGGANALVPEVSLELIQAEILNNFMHLIFSGHIKIISNKPANIYEISDKPKISALSRFQIDRPSTDGVYWITNALNAIVAFKIQHIKLIKSLDGTKTIKQLQKQTLESFKKGEIVASENNEKIEDEARLKPIADNLVNNTLGALRQNFCLIA
ncbi:MAG: hypothetical protein COA94_01790 [Rickettsiales bacterium]|nr:MAG: hypothetical protein COA94_01790 [Rickettsiales bacterium]